MSNYQNWKYGQNGLCILIVILVIFMQSAWEEKNPSKSKQLTSLLVSLLCVSFVLFLYRYIVHRETHYYTYRFRQKLDSVTHLFLIVFLLGAQIVPIWLSSELISQLSDLEKKSNIPNRKSIEMDDKSSLGKLNTALFTVVLAPIVFSFIDPLRIFFDRVVFN